jgi:hypothetical protein
MLEQLVRHGDDETHKHRDKEGEDLSKRHPKDKQRYTLYLATSQVDLLRRLSGKAGHSVSALVGQALYDHLKSLGLDIEGARPAEAPLDKKQLRSLAAEIRPHIV